MNHEVHARRGGFRPPGGARHPSIAEDICVARDAAIAEYTGAHIHIAHIASKGAVDIVRKPRPKG